MPDIKPMGFEWFFRNRGIRPLVWQQDPCILASSQREAAKPVQGYRSIFAGTAAGRYDQLTAADHLILAIKYESPDIYTLSKIFLNLSDEELDTLKKAIVRNASSVHSRKLGYLYEKLTGDIIDIPAEQKSNIRKARADNLLDSDVYITRQFTDESEKSTDGYVRWRIVDNSLGVIGKFCPFIRKAPEAPEINNYAIQNKFTSYMEAIPHKIRSKIADGLYDADTGASFRIEGENMEQSEDRRHKFTRALKRMLADKNFEIDEQTLASLQNIVCEGHVADMATGYRKLQNAIGGTAGSPAYLCPPPNIVPELMQSLGEIRRNLKGMSDPGIAAAAISGSFVFIHPFLDGNGRLSRALMHEAIHAPDNSCIIPVSLAIERNRADYIAALVEATGPVMSRTTFDIKDNYYRITSSDNDLFRYPDLTQFANFIHKMLYLTVEEYVPKETSMMLAELSFRQALPASIKFPDKLAHILAQSMAENNGVPAEEAEAIIAKVYAELHPEYDNER